jgi:hypothetical protein
MTVNTRAHIVTIRRNGEPIGEQLRVGPGAGQSRYFSVAVHGNHMKARAAANQAANDAGFVLGNKRGGSESGRRTKLSPTSAAGIRWYWSPYYGSATLKVVASWVDKDGRARSSNYSVARNGLTGALELAVAKRISAGAPVPNVAKLRRELGRAFRSGPEA